MGKRKSKTSIDDYMSGVRKFLESQYGQVNAEWEINLLVLEDTLLRYTEIKEVLKRDGIYDSQTAKRHHLLSTEKDCITTITRLVNKLGISPWDASKLNTLEDDSGDDFLDDLTK